jgi:hypothetical protein
VDWGRFVEWAARHRISSLVSLRLGDRHGALREAAEENARRALFMTGELLRVLDAFESEGIAAIPYKGPALAALAYGNVGLRECGDLDLIVRRKDLARAKEALIRRGYRPEFELNRAQEAGYLRSQFDLGFFSPDETYVEIHWRVAPAYYGFEFDYDGLWERLGSVSIAGRAVPTPRVEDYLILLSVHGAKHMWERLIWICDIAELVAEGPDWGLLFSRSESCGAGKMVDLALLLSNVLLKAPLPGPILKRVRADLSLPSLAARVVRALFEGHRRLPSRLERLWFDLRLKRGFGERGRYLARLATIPNERDWGLVGAPFWVRPLSMIVRPLRMMMAEQIRP